MKSARGFLTVFDSLLDRVLCIVGAIMFSQGPEFMQQYLQRLGGHLAEARRQLAAFQNTAASSGLTMDELVQKTNANADQAVARLGGLMTDTMERVHSLQSAHDALINTALWERPFVFLRHIDPAIANATAAIYKPAVPTTVEGVLYALTGMLIVLGIYHLGAKRLIGVFSKPRLPSKSTA
jgi:hypothetical protein